MEKKKKKKISKKVDTSTTKQSAMAIESTYHILYISFAMAS